MTREERLGCLFIVAAGILGAGIIYVGLSWVLILLAVPYE